jgi:hypothetical protein
MSDITFVTDKTMGSKFRGIPVPFLTTPEFRVEFRGIPGAGIPAVEFRIPTSIVKYVKPTRVQFSSS